MNTTYNARTRVAVVMFFGAMGVISCGAQTTPREVPRSFDIVSIKPNQTGSDSRRATTTAGGIFTATNVSLRLLIARAFGVAEFQIERGPGWIDTEKYDVASRADTPLEMSREEVRPCLQAMLAERFRLKFHRVTRQGSMYSLRVGKSGSRLTEHSGAGTSGIGSSSGSGQVNITGTKVTIARLAEYLSEQAGRPVVDNTGLRGDYDFRVEWGTEDTGTSGPSPFAALEEQLGLTISTVKGPIEVIVVDGAEKASAN